MQEADEGATVSHAGVTHAACPSRQRTSQQYLGHGGQGQITSTQNLSHFARYFLLLHEGATPIETFEVNIYNSLFKAIYCIITISFADFGNHRITWTNIKTPLL